MNSSFRTAPLSGLVEISLIPTMLAAVMAVLPYSALGQTRSDAPGSGLVNPRAIVFNPAAGKVYAVDTNHAAVQIYNDALHTSRSVRVGAAPVSIAVNTASGRVYVANAGDGTVTVLDGASDEVVATVPVGPHPYSIAANPVTSKVYVSHTYADHISILDGATNSAASLSILERTPSTCWDTKAER
jgi:YVTN family beta-propeller protein